MKKPALLNAGMKTFVGVMVGLALNSSILTKVIVNVHSRKRAQRFGSNTDLPSDVVFV